MKRLALAAAVAIIAWPKIEHGIGYASNEHGDYGYIWARVFIGGHALEVHWSSWR